MQLQLTTLYRVHHQSTATTQLSKQSDSFNSINQFKKPSPPPMYGPRTGRQQGHSAAFAAVQHHRGRRRGCGGGGRRWGRRGWGCGVGAWCQPCGADRGRLWRQPPGPPPSVQHPGAITARHARQQAKDHPVLRPEEGGRRGPGTGGWGPGVGACARATTCSVCDRRVVHVCKHACMRFARTRV